MAYAGEVSGYVLAGGKSSRMGQDKAALAWGDGTLLDHVTEVVRKAVGNVKVVRPFRTVEASSTAVPDMYPDRGPLSGLFSALLFADTDWVLITACDMPNLTPEFLRGLAEAAQSSDADAVVATTERGLHPQLHPLCAAYHVRLRSAVESRVTQNLLKMHDFLATIRIQRHPAPDPALLANINTPEDLATWETQWKTR